MATHEQGPKSALRRELMALGAETLYKRLTKQLADLKAAYPAIAKKYGDVQAIAPAVPENGHNPAPEALELFRSRGKGKGRPPSTKRRTGRPRPEKRAQPGALPKPGTLSAFMVERLRQHGPMTALALANRMFEDGVWQPKTANTPQKRAQTVTIMLRQFIRDARKLVKVAGGKGTSTSPRLYAAF